MSVRVHDLAKRCGISNKEMIEKLRSMKYPVKSHSSTIDKITAESLENEYGYVPPVAPSVELPPSPPPAPPVVPAPTVPIASPEPPSQTERPTTLRPTGSVVSPAHTHAPSARHAAVPTKISAPVVPVVPPKAAQVFKPVKPAAVSSLPPRVAPPAARPAPAPTPAEPPFIIDEQGNKVIQMKPPIVVRDLAARIGKKPHLMLMELMEMNVFANVNESIGEDAARKICERHGFLFDLEKRERGAGTVHRPPPKPEIADEEDVVEDLQPRPPVVTVMGHVDHGKTSLLDAIRKTNVVAGESGGITQHIGASVVVMPDGKQITFLDTPGHEAFAKMRARGANITDIVILVVGADDGVMPQTIEAINHAKAAKVPIIVAVNKCDLPTANPDRVKKQLQEHGLSPESWGGENITVDVSATTKKNLDHLLEMILLQAEIMELKASRKRAAKGNVIEAQLESGMGPTATVLVRKGTLRVGDAIICGPYEGKVRALINDKGRRVKEATPSAPVKIVGLTGLPEAGAEFSVVNSEKEARQLGEQRQMVARTQAAGLGTMRHTTMEGLMSQIEDDKKKTLSIVLKADVQGSLEAITESLGKLKSDKVELNLIHAAVGSVTENDVLLASASDAVIIGFRVKLEGGVSDMAKRENVQIKLYAIIYELLEDAEKAMEGLLEPESREIVTGHAEVREVFTFSKGPSVAGCMVTSGRITRGSRVRVLRSKAVQYEGRIASLKHFKNDLKEVKAGMECGLRLENYQDFLAGDILECYSVEKVMPKL